MDAKLAVLAALALLSKPQAVWPAPPTRVPATVVVPAGTFVLGHSAPLPINLTNNILQRVWGDADEWPKTPVNITRPFHAAVTEVTNAQFEAFDPSHSRYRGLYPGLGLGDDEAVLFVTWAEAAGYASWLANQTDTPFRLPTEGEWEWMCRAGTLSAFSTGDSIPAAQQKNQQQTTKPPSDVNLTVAMSPPNAFGLHDCIGNVEEWVSDWYGPYAGGTTVQQDPPGPADGTFKVTRGGSHSTESYYLRTANRLGALPEDRLWTTGFRVVADLGHSGGDDGRGTAAAGEDAAAPASPASPAVNKPKEAPSSTVVNTGGWSRDPTFLPPLSYMNVGSAIKPPFNHHNHDPALAVCPNGDVFATWFSTYSESGREMLIAQSRLRAGSDRWEAARVFFDAPDRMDVSPILFCERNMCLHMHGMSVGAGQDALTTVLHHSTDCGLTWSKPSLPYPRHEPGFCCQQFVTTAFRTHDGKHIVVPADDNPVSGTRLHVSADDGITWQIQNTSMKGIHGAVVQLRNGSILGFGRGRDVKIAEADGRTRNFMSMQLSSNLGQSWSTHKASPFQGIHGGERDTMIRAYRTPQKDLQDSVLVECTFAGGDERGDKTNHSVTFQDREGGTFEGMGLYCAVSADEGESWSHRRLVSDDSAGNLVALMDGVTQTNASMGGGYWRMTHTQGEGGYKGQDATDWWSNGAGAGYCAMTQDDTTGMVHLISSRNHYRFNVAWLEALPAAAPVTMQIRR